MCKYPLKVDEIEVTVEVKNVRGLRLRVSAKGVFMSVPPGTSPELCRCFVNDHIGWIRSRLKSAIDRERSKPELTMDHVRRFILAVRPRFEMWERRMGLTASRISFKLMTSRWGSCNHLTGAISINVMLALYPEECADYVIVHELAHLLHPNHSPAFWSVVEEYIPQWRKLRAILRG